MLDSLLPELLLLFALSLLFLPIERRGVGLTLGFSGRGSSLEFSDQLSSNLLGKLLQIEPLRPRGLGQTHGRGRHQLRTHRDGFGGTLLLNLLLGKRHWLGLVAHHKL